MTASSNKGFVLQLVACVEGKGLTKSRRFLLLGSCKANHMQSDAVR